MKGITIHKSKAGSVTAVTLTRKHHPDVVEDILDSAIVEKSFKEPLIDGDLVMRKMEKKLNISNGKVQGTVQKKRSKKH